LTVKARSAEQARKGAEAVTFTAKTNAGRVQLIVSLPNSSTSSRTSFQSDLEIRAPQSVAIRTRNGFGETRIRGVQGEVEATSQHGSMEIRDAGAKVRAQTSFATLTLDNSGPATLKNSQEHRGKQFAVVERNRLWHPKVADIRGRSSMKPAWQRRGEPAGERQREDFVATLALNVSCCPVAQQHGIKHHLRHETRSSGS
jgi:hypothetical protein